MNAERNMHVSGRVALVLAAAAVLLAGCPNIATWEYDLGFAAGFAEDEEYWQGYDDSWDTVDFGPIYYQGSTIPDIETPPYEAGYWDGVWYAYNDGYFVAYDFAFTIGFSEGYDLAFSPEWPAFLAADEPIEYLDGGFSDGYNDGFSEGRVFGAWDFEEGWTFDWLDAMLDYRDGMDLAIAGISTGVNGPVELYEYGTDPAHLVKSASRARRRPDRPAPAIRKRGLAKAEAPALTYRPLTGAASSELDVLPGLSPRSDRQLLLTSTWLERINAYLDTLDYAAKTYHRSRATAD